MARYALITGSTVVSVVEMSAEQATAALTAFEVVHELAANSRCASGWSYAGGDVVAPEVVAPVPAEVTMRQARLALLAAGLLDDVEAAIAGMDEPAKTAAQIEWEYSNALQRDNALVAVLGPALGLSENQIDSLFRAAAQL